MLSLFNRKKSVKLDGAAIVADMHSHILPGIDDGARDIESSIVLIEGLKALGYKKLIATPHIFWTKYENTPDIINLQLEIVKAELVKRNIEMEVSVAAEYFMDGYFENLLDTNQPLLTLDGKMVLIEFSFVTKPIKIKEIIFKMQLAGYQPVLAHPERYIYFHEQKSFFLEMYDMGCILQLNILSYSGYYGTTVKEVANYLLKNNLYSIIGTDLHNLKYLDALNAVKMADKFLDLVYSDSLLNKKL